MIHRVKSAYLAVGLCIGTIIQRVLTSQTKKYIQSIADRVDRMNFIGICGMCEYFNGFHTESEYPNGIYCTHPKGPENRRNVMPHINAGYGREVTSFNYTYFTCDRYKVDHSWKETLKREALEGKIPKNFDPDTFEPLEYMEGVPVEAWEKSQQEYEDRKPENVKKKKLKELLKNKVRKMEVGNADRR